MAEQRIARDDDVCAWDNLPHEVRAKSTKERGERFLVLRRQGRKSR
jgi:hypothetical protein